MGTCSLLLALQMPQITKVSKHGPRQPDERITIDSGRIGDNQPDDETPLLRDSSHEAGLP